MPLLRTAIPLFTLLAAVATAQAAPTAPSGFTGRPFGDAAHAASAQSIPGPVFCAYYDQGGEGVAYHDTDPENHGSGRLNQVDGSYLHEFRLREGIDTSYTKRVPDRESPCNRVTPPLGLLYVGWNEPGEWFRLTVETARAGDYVADVLYTSQRGATVRIDVEGQPAGPEFAFPSTYDPAETIPWRQWHHWAVARDAFSVRLPQGRSVLTVRILTGGNMNLATLLFRPAGAPRDEAAILTANTPAAPRTVWRPFSDDSPWNQPIGDDITTDPRSPDLIDDFAARGPLHINIADWSVPVYFVDADRTPKCDVGDSRPGVYGAGFELPRAIPIPDDAVASPPFTDDSDNHLCIVDRSRHLEWGMWAARKDASGRWFTGLGAVTDLAGSGVAVPWFVAPRELDSHRARAGGFPLIAGLILREEIRAGRIDHALVFAYDHCRGGLFIPPASTAQVATPAINERTGIPMGGRIQLDPAWDVETSGLSRSGKIIARALQQYGAFCGDFAGANVIYVENSPAAVHEWQGVVDYDELKAVFTPEFIRRHFRVIAMGNLLPGQNLSAPAPYVLAATIAGETAPAEIDPLERTIAFHLPAGATVGWAQWTLFPAASKAAWARGADEARSSLTVTAPDGRTTTWQIAVVRTAP